MKTRVSHRLVAVSLACLVHAALTLQSTDAFAPEATINVDKLDVHPRARTALSAAQQSGDGDADSAPPALTAKDTAPPSSASRTIDQRKAFPVISQISGLEFTGTCRYVNARLTPLTNLQLSGGSKYDIDGTSLTLTSYLTFPNGQTRNVVMKGERTKFPPEHEVMMLHPTEDEGPIVMQLSEVYPDTILINEIEKASGRIVMTSSVNIVQGAKGPELVGVSHEVGNDNSKEGGGEAIEGHQIWRMAAAQQGTMAVDEWDYRSATSW